MNDPASLQSRLGYQFKDQGLLSRALTHRSRGRSNNERLEYLGDSILGFVMAEALYARFPAAPEGDLTRMRAHLVCGPALAERARSIKVERCLLLGGSVRKSGGGERDAILADAFEALVGAVYLDGGMATVKAVLLALFDDQLKQISPRDLLKDHKTRLQERLQKRGLPLPVYEVVGQSGKSHAPTFTVSCQTDGIEEPVIAAGDSRRNAEQSAACKALSLLEDNA